MDFFLASFLYFVKCFEEKLLNNPVLFKYINVFSIENLQIFLIENWKNQIILILVVLYSFNSMLHSALNIYSILFSLGSWHKCQFSQLSVFNMPISALGPFVFGLSILKPAVRSHSSQYFFCQNMLNLQSSCEECFSFGANFLHLSDKSKSRATSYQGTFLKKCHNISTFWGKLSEFPIMP